MWSSSTSHWCHIGCGLLRLKNHRETAHAIKTMIIRGAGVFGRSEPQPRLLLVTANGSFWPTEILDCRAVNPALGVRRISKNAPESTRTKPVALIWRPSRLSEARIIIEDFRREGNQQRPRSQPSCQI
jgi:hypothetical protein